MIPEQHMDFSMLDLSNDSFYQPQVFSVLSLPETVIDTEILSGKSASSPVFSSQNEKVELPSVERMPATNPEKELKPLSCPAVDEEFDADPSFALFSARDQASTTPQELDLTALITSINISKPTEYELVSASEADDSTSNAAMRRVERTMESLESVVERLSGLILDL